MLQNKLSFSNITASVALFIALGGTSYAAVIDVPANASGVVFGLLLVGSGEARIRDARLEIVGSDVPVTAVPY